MARQGAFFYFFLMAVVSALLLAGGADSARAQGLLESLTGATAKPAQPAPRKPRTPQTGAAAEPNKPTAAIEDARHKAGENAVTILGSGRLTGYTQMAEDIANVIEAVPGNDLRVIPVLGQGAGQNVMDMLTLKGMDMGIVDQDVLKYVKKKDPAQYGDADKRITYITKLLNFELQIYAKKDIAGLEDLAGKKISCLKEHSTVAVLCRNLFQALKINAEIVYDDVEQARRKVMSGEIAAAARGASPPLPGLDKIKPEDGLHFLPISEEALPKRDFTAIRAAYLPARLRSEDYPNLIPAGEEVPTIASVSLLAVYAGPPGSARYQRLQKFVQVFFDNVDGLRKPPRHPKWSEVNLAAEIPGWTRFPPAQEWLKAKRKDLQRQTAENEAKMKAAFKTFVDEQAKTNGQATTPAQRDALYAQFVQWWEKAKKP